jgi:riboflavin synthase
MFTGLIADMGTVRALRRESEGARLTVTTAFPMAELQLGESIAVNGACLTVVAFGSGIFTADVSPETLERTTLGELAPGHRVNLERALRLSDRLGGHLVSGHVDAVASVAERHRDGNAERFTFLLPAAANRFVAEKGSVTVDGISLTVNAVTEEGFSVAVIPHTLARTTLQECAIGHRVNVEVDLLARYVARLLGGGGSAAEGGRLDLDFLAKHGFL